MRETNICFFCVLNNAIIRLGGEGKGKGRAQLTWVGRRRRNATTTIFFPWVPQEHVIPPSVQGSPVSASVFFFCHLTGDVLHQRRRVVLVAANDSIPL